MDGIPLTEELKATLNQFYVYAYIRQRNSPIGNVGTPYYIGKGKDDRAWQKHGKTTVPKDISRIIIVGQNLTEEEAFTLEVKMIADYGRVDNKTGILRNRTDGGEGASGAIRTEDFKRKVSERLKNRIHITNGIDERMIDPTDIIPSGWRKGLSDSSRDKLRKSIIGRPCSEETRRKISEKSKGRTHSEEAKRKISVSKQNMSEETRRKLSVSKQNPSQETRRKLSEAGKGRIFSEETRRKLSEKSKVRTHSEEAKRKIGEIHKGKTISEETRRKLSEAGKGKTPWNKGRTHSEETRRKMSDAAKSRRNTVASGSDIYAFLDGKA